MSMGVVIFLVVLALAFDFMNGFHDVFIREFENEPRKAFFNYFVYS